MIQPILPDPLPFRVLSDDDIRVGDGRVQLEIVVDAYERGASPEDIVRSYDTLRLADVYGSIAFYLRHKQEVKDYIERRDQRAEEWRKKLEAEGISRPEFWQELLARRARMEKGDAPAADR